MFLAGDGTGCLSSVFVCLDTVCSWRRALRREESCCRSFLIPRGSVLINDQSKHATGVNGLLSSFGTPSIAARLFVLLDAGPCRLEGEGVRRGFILLLSVTQDKE